MYVRVTASAELFFFLPISHSPISDGGGVAGKSVRGGWLTTTNFRWAIDGSGRPLPPNEKGSFILCYTGAGAYGPTYIHPSVHRRHPFFLFFSFSFTKIHDSPVSSLSSIGLCLFWDETDVNHPSSHTYCSRWNGRQLPCTAYVKKQLPVLVSALSCISLFTARVDNYVGQQPLSLS